MLFRNCGDFSAQSVGEIHSISRKMGRESLVFGFRSAQRGVVVHERFVSRENQNQRMKTRRVQKFESFSVTKAPFSCRFVFSPPLKQAQEQTKREGQ